MLYPDAVEGETVQPVQRIDDDGEIGQGSEGVHTAASIDVDGAKGSSVVRNGSAEPPSLNNPHIAKVMQLESSDGGALSQRPLHQKGCSVSGQL